MFVPQSNAFTQAEEIVLNAHTETNEPAMPLGGFIAGSLVETDTGWKPVETVRQDQEVFTYDGGKRPVRDVEILQFGHSALASDLVHLPGGILGANDDITLLADQFLMLDDCTVYRLFGQSQVLVRVADLVGWSGIRSVSQEGQVKAVRLIFEEEELVWVNGGMRLFCKPVSAGSSFFETLTPAQTRLLRAVLDDHSACISMAA